MVYLNSINSVTALHLLYIHYLSFCLFYKLSLKSIYQTVFITLLKYQIFKKSFL